MVNDLPALSSLRVPPMECKQGREGIVPQPFPPYKLVPPFLTAKIRERNAKPERYLLTTNPTNRNES